MGEAAVINNQVDVLRDYWPADGIDWFVIGGPANYMEAQWLHRYYPSLQCIGFEPNREYADLQNGTLGFPGQVHCCALWDTDRVALTLSRPEGATPLSASVCRPDNAPDSRGCPLEPLAIVPGRTLDSLSAQYGPFTRCALWLDIEYAELAALRGAESLLASGQVQLVNLETFAHLNLPAIVELLDKYGLRLRKVWNVGNVAGRDAQDYLFSL